MSWLMIIGVAYIALLIGVCIGIGIMSLMEANDGPRKRYT